MSVGREVLLILSWPLLLLSGLGMLLPIHPAAAQEPAVIRGVVHDSTAAAPLEGATVILSGTAERTITRADGTFHFEQVLPGSHRLSFFHSRLDELGLVSASWEVEITEGEEREVDLWIPSVATLANALCRSEPGVLLGVLREEGSGAGVEGSVVARWETEGRSRTSGTETEEGGRYVLCGLPVGTLLRVQGISDGRTSETDDLRLPPTGLAARDVGIVLDPTGIVSGRIVTMDDGAPVEGASVRIEGATRATTSDAGGRFRIASPSPGRQILEVEHLSFGVHRDIVEVEPGAVLEVTIEVPIEPVELEEIEVIGRRPLGSARERFEARRRMGRGDFILPEVFDDRRYEPLSQVIARHSGLQRRCTSSQCRLYSRRVPMRGGSCRIQFYIDGVYFPLPLPNDHIDLLIPTNDVQMAEVYLGPSQIPVEYNRHDGMCGVVLIWTSHGPS